jgi:hypothetical protein
LVGAQAFLIQGEARVIEKIMPNRLAADSDAALVEFRPQFTTGQIGPSATRLRRGTARKQKGTDMIDAYNDIWALSDDRSRPRRAIPLSTQACRHAAWWEELIPDVQHSYALLLMPPKFAR